MQNNVQRIRVLLTRVCLSEFYILKLLLCGMMFSLSFAPVFFTPALLMLAPLAFFARYAESTKQLLFGSAAWSFGANLVGLYWIALAPLVYGSEMLVVSIAALIGIPILLSLPMILSVMLTRAIASERSFYFIFAISWMIFEWLRSWIFTGFPWNLVAYSVSNYLSLMQSVSIISIYGLGFVLVYIATNWLQILEEHHRRKHLIVYASSVLITVFILISYGYARLASHPLENTDITIRLVQPSIPQQEKWDERLLVQNLAKHQELSAMHFDVSGKSVPDIIIWPESAITKSTMGTKVPGVITKNIPVESLLLSGGVSLERALDEDFRLYVTMFAIKGDTILSKYFKSHLVPFGEYVPYKKYLPFYKLTEGMMDYSSGKVGKVINFSELNLIIRPLICYESIFPHEITRGNSAFDAFINITNDSWYGNSSGPYQHFEATKVRAIEFGVPLLRVASNGITAIIDPVGRVVSRTILDEETVIDGLLPKRLTQTTTYSLFGNLCALLIVVFLYSFRRWTYKSLKNS